jgi:hypothetical protein
MSEMFSGANPTRTVMTLDDETWTNGKNNSARLLPNPNAMSIGSLTELSSLPFFKKRSGLNMCGSG